jgi:hypothetical protein
MLKIQMSKYEKLIIEENEILLRASNGERALTDAENKCLNEIRFLLSRVSQVIPDYNFVEEYSHYFVR